MTEAEFIKEYKGTTHGVWSKTASYVFWAAAYNADDNTLLLMSKDFLSIPGIKPGCSSYSLAKLYSGMRQR